MVATKIHEVAGKGIEWATSGGSTSDTPTPPPPLSSNPTAGYSETLWNYANDSLSRAAETTVSTLSGYLPTFTSTTTDTSQQVLKEPQLMENLPQETPQRTPWSRQKSFSSPLALFQNPYINVRGGRSHQPHPPSSMEAVRSLLSVVPVDDTADNASDASSQNGDSIVSDNPPWTSARLAQTNSTSSETASQLAEGTIRAFRDLALDEAVELHAALRFWSYRWERPLLSWLEAGPTVWFSESGYRHQIVGQKVSQIQAVLARRLASIGDLQQHLLRAGWQRGVAQWGVLGDGGEWAAVAGFDGTMDYPRDKLERMKSSSELIEMPVPAKPKLDELPNKPSSSVSNLPQRSRHSALYYTNVFVKNNHDGKIFIDDPALAEWSIDAMGIVRRQLFRAANGVLLLPCSENWAESDDTIEGSGSFVAESETAPNNDDKLAPPRKLPLWAGYHKSRVDESSDEQETAERMEISDLPLLVAEVSALLNVMGDVMDMQRARRLEKLKPPQWIRQNWYVSAIAVPTVTYLLYKMKAHGYGFMKIAAQKMLDFFREHVRDPFRAIIADLLKGTENISDREARNVTIDNLKVMIRSWLDDNYPNMSVAERARRAEAMDLSLIEARKSESLRTIYEINNVIRMSFIEAQFIKKEMMNALLALDEMQASNNINMNMAAVTPAVLLLYTAKRAFQFLFYALFKLGKSREETYGSFLHVLTEMERLLVMRDNPPTPPILSAEDNIRRQHETTSHLAVSEDTVLSADDLGMLMLHIHELRTILWQDRRRFSPDMVRSIAEDLAELAGERGAVSVRQQLQIIQRMCRIYPFLKVVNSRTFFEYAKGN